jgi:hypothetical protein
MKPDPPALNSLHYCVASCRCRTVSSKDSKFFLVWSPGGYTPPKVRYPTRSEADVAAQAMAARYIGQEFFVLEAIGRSVATAAVTVTTLG